MPEAELIETFWPNRNQPTTEKPIVKMIKNKLVVTCETEGANIGYKYLKRDLKPWIGWRPYTKPISYSRGIDKIEFKAHRIGFLPSEKIIY